MSERLDRIESLLESTAQRLDSTAQRLDSTAQRLDQTAAQQTKHTEDIDTLLGAIALSEARVGRLTVRSEAADLRLDRLIERAEAADLRFEVLRAEAVTDRQEFRQQFNDAINQMRIDREEARAQAEADRQKADERHAAQMEVIQTLLLELTKTNGNVTKLRDRMDGLERAN